MLPTVKKKQNSRIGKMFRAVKNYFPNCIHCVGPIAFLPAYYLSGCSSLNRLFHKKPNIEPSCVKAAGADVS